jgi:catechol 2,3-dioxygenase-like lactoylglutathione lyase family enzyme
MADGGAIRSGEVEVGLVVSDLQASLSFYGELLGLEYVGEVALPGMVQKRFLRGDAVVKLIYFDEQPDVTIPPGRPDPGQLGLRYLSVKVPDVVQTVERWVGRGGIVAVPLFEWEPGVHIAVIEDPDGIWVELGPQGKPSRTAGGTR